MDASTIHLHNRYWEIIQEKELGSILRYSTLQSLNTHVITALTVSPFIKWGFLIDVRILRLLIWQCKK
jgi:hypothetical protein